MRWALSKLMFLTVMLQLTGLAAAQQGAAPAPPGRLIDLGGFQVHIHCVGHGRPPVIFLHGLGDYSFVWALVQPALAERTEACAYDRPGQAWSEPGPKPRGISTSARELHLLLQRAGVRGPYVLVGHSWGGLIARMYAHEYPQEVAGMVLVDSAHEDEYLWLNGKIIRPRFMADQEWADLMHPQKAAPAGPPSGPAPQAAAPSQRRVPKLFPPYDKLPLDSQALMIWTMSLPWTKARDEGGDAGDMRQDLISMYRIRAGSDHSLGSIPLIVLSKTPGVDDDDDYAKDQLVWNRGLQEDLATLSTNSEHKVVDHSGHSIHLDQPEAVIAAVRRVLSAVKHKRTLAKEPLPAR
jgi:pimeloyl-ACP methyl ester carboxylesterase